MKLPLEQQLLLLATYHLVDGDHQRSIRARALVKRFEFGRDGADWMFEAIENLTDLGLLSSLLTDGLIDVQPIQLTSGGVVEAQRIMDGGARLAWKENWKESQPESVTRYLDVPSEWPSDVDPEDDMEVPRPPTSTASSNWTGLVGVQDQVKRVATLAPLAMHDIEKLINETRLRRFNDRETEEALVHLRELHSALGDLLNAAEAGAPLQSAFRLVRRHKAAFIASLRQGAKVAIAAPALTLGVVHLLSTISGIVPDSQLLGTVYAAMVGGDALRQMGWRNRR